MNRATWNQNAIFMATRIQIQCAVSRTRVYSNQSFPYSLCLFYNSNRGYPEFSAIYNFTVHTYVYTKYYPNQMQLEASDGIVM